MSVQANLPTPRCPLCRSSMVIRTLRSSGWCSVILGWLLFGIGGLGLLCHAAIGGSAAGAIFCAGLAWLGVKGIGTTQVVLKCTVCGAVVPCGLVM